MQGVAAHFFLAGADDHLVHAAHMGRTGFAETGLHACQVLQLQRHMLHDVAGPRAFTQALQKATTHARAAMVLFQRGQPGSQPIIETRQGVGRAVFQVTNVYPSFQGWAVCPDIGSAQIRDTKKTNVLVAHGWPGRLGPVLWEQHGLVFGC